MNKKVKPIFVIGINRSGTKWLSNILCNHEDIIGVQSERHTGIIETNMFGSFKMMFEDLSRLDNYVGLIELWAKTDFFLASGIDKDFFYHLEPRPITHLNLFEIFMDELAIRNNKKYWLQKLSPFSASDVINYFDNAIFIFIKRDIVNTLTSTLKMRKIQLRKSNSIPRLVFLYEIQMKILKSIISKDSIVIEYDSLYKNPEKPIKQICDSIGLNYSPSLLNIKYKRNSSFKHAEKEVLFSQKEIYMIRLLYKLFDLIPLNLQEKMFELLRPNGSLGVVHLTFGEIRYKYGIINNVDENWNPD